MAIRGKADGHQEKMERVKEQSDEHLQGTCDNHGRPSQVLGLLETWLLMVTNYLDNWGFSSRTLRWPNSGSLARGFRKGSGKGVGLVRTGVKAEGLEVLSRIGSVAARVRPPVPGARLRFLRQPRGKRLRHPPNMASAGAKVGVVLGKAPPPERFSNGGRPRVHGDGGGGSLLA